ncbi:MAG: SRPBCC family protein [Devosia nanyangense]|uniref:SRPBCC family protein n=1 Tax=Devosia nanyangense TaxID=1228055 RepID=A0A933KZV3_9HYPH|nr:SRPBCC family protein [Devosia nanyangense]
MPEPLVITTPGDRAIVVVRSFDAPRNLVWLCYSKPELLRRWYGLPDWTMPVCDMDFRVGGKWRFVSRSPDGYEMGSQGIYTGIVEPERIEQTEFYDDDWTKGGSENSVVFTETGGRTISTLTVTYSSPEARAAAVATPMAVGMEIGFKRLDAALAELQKA